MTHPAGPQPLQGVTNSQRIAGAENGHKEKGRSGSVVSLDHKESMRGGHARVQMTPAEVYAFTSRNLLRTYPAGWRVMSSNYSPLTAWNQVGPWNDAACPGAVW